MTNEEAITVLSVLKNNEGILENEQNVDALITAISSLESQRWIPVTERLPEDGYVLTCDSINDIKILEYHAYDGGSSYGGKGFYSEDYNGYNRKEEDTKYWMQLPKPPKEERT